MKVLASHELIPKPFKCVYETKMGVVTLDSVTPQKI